MRATDVLEVIETLDGVGVPTWLDGGWGVDALVGEETREHADIDLAIDRDRLDDAERALAGLGFERDETATPGGPARVVLKDKRGRCVDVHPLVFDRNGNGWQQLSRTGRAWGLHPGEDLEATGTIGGHRVHCISPQLQLRFRLGYEWSERDEHDLHLLADHFDVRVPPTLRRHPR